MSCCRAEIQCVCVCVYDINANFPESLILENSAIVLSMHISEQAEYHHDMYIFNNQS